MVKKQVDFQMASYQFAPGDADIQRMRMEVSALQSNGWEVLEVIHGGVRKDPNSHDVNHIMIAMVKYEWVDEADLLPKPKSAKDKPKAKEETKEPEQKEESKEK